MERTLEVPHLAVDPGRERGPGQTGADALGRLLTAGGLRRHLPDAAVRQRQADRAHCVVDHRTGGTIDRESTRGSVQEVGREAATSRAARSTQRVRFTGA